MSWTLGENVTVLAPVYGTDARGGQSLPTAWDTKATYSNIVVAPGFGSTASGRSSNRPGAAENTDGQETVEIGISLYGFPPGSDIRALDRVIVRGQTWNVVDTPQVWMSPFDGWAPGMSVQASLVTG